MDRKAVMAVLVVVLVVALAAAGVAGYYFFFRTQTASVNGITENGEDALQQTLPSVTIQEENEAVDVRTFYLDCKADEYDRTQFLNQLQVHAPLFSSVRVSLGSQPFGPDGQDVEQYTLAPDAVDTIAKQFEIDPRIIVTLIELETAGVSNPARHPRFPLLYPEVIVTPEGTSVKRDEFQIQVGIAAEAIKKVYDELQSDPQYSDGGLVFAQAVIQYLIDKGYTVSRIEQWTRPGEAVNFVRVFRELFETDPRVCRS